MPRNVGVEAVRVHLRARTASLLHEGTIWGTLPPSMIEGLLAAALGRDPSGAGVQFAYHMISRTCRDHLEPRRVLVFEGRPRIVIEPLRREILFGVDLEIHILRGRIAARRILRGFLSPAWPLSLGGSPSGALVVEAALVRLEQGERAYLAHTVLPFSFRHRVGHGTTVLLPRHVGPPPARLTTIEPYVLLREAVFVRSRRLGSFWVDPESPAIDGCPRGLVFHPVDPSHVNQEHEP